MAKFVSNKRSVNKDAETPKVAWERKDSSRGGWQALKEKVSFQAAISDQMLSDFFDHLTTLLGSGITLMTALTFSETATRHPGLKQVIHRMSEKIRGGAKFSDAVAEELGVFDHVVLGMVKSAEASGRIEEILKELAGSYARRAELKRQVLQALAYPAIVAGFGFLTVIVLLVFVIPKLKSVFDLWETPLPLVTSILLQVSDVLTHGGFLILIAAPIVAYLFIRLVLRKSVKQLTFPILARLPILKPLFFLTDFVRLTRTWGMLLRAGVPILDSIKFSEDVLEDKHMKKALGEIVEKTARGARLQESVQEEAWFPELAKNFLMIGEESGTLDQSFEKITNFYERELNKKLRTITTFLEPILILVIGVIVGFLVISLLLPIFEMSLVVK
jgi:type II secretory pathway component PulF